MSRINRMKQALNRLKRYVELSLDDILEQDLTPSLEREVQVTIEVLLDIGSAIISSMGWGVPSSYREIAILLFKNNVLDKDLSDKLASLSGLRNIIVHLYSMVDHELLYKHAKALLDDSRQILMRMLKYMEEHGIDP